ncbi:radical SAM protein [Myxococcota bacterium]|nr:radical SAM protein [Myxococcota bacterium]
MLYTAGEKNSIINKNMNEYGSIGRFMQFVDAAGAADLSRLRDGLVARLDRLHVEYGAHGTKLDMRKLSPGCRICVEGNWSCLFVNNLCNASCFYCPSSQNDLSTPATNHLQFDDAGFYAGYLRRFGFTGASISGGEPFLSLEKSLDYIRAIREVNGPRFHIWMYTNGLLATKENLRRLAGAGLDELRFDLTAVRYDVEKAAMACGIIETVTVEVPAIEGEAPQLEKMALELAAAGVGHLNLHQLRCTPHSVAKMIERGLSFIHAPFVLSAWSEVVALETMARLLESGTELPVHFCSFLYKYHSQNSAARRRSAAALPGTGNTVTAAGYVREITSHGVPVSTDDLRNHACDSIRLEYFEGRITQVHEATDAAVFSLAGRSLFIQKRKAMHPIELDGGEVDLYRTPFLKDFTWHADLDPDDQLHLSPALSDKFSAIRSMEVLPEGLIEYF